MTWSRIKAVIDSGDKLDFKRLIASADYWHSDVSVLLRTASELRSKKRVAQALLFLRRLELRNLKISLTAAILLKHIQAECYLDLEQFDQAVRAYNWILSKRQDSVAYSNRALAHWELGDYQSALRDYTKALQRDQNNILVLYGIGEILNKLGKHHNAIKYLKKAITLKPNCSKAHTALGVCYYNTQNWLEAYRSLRKAAQLNPEDKVARLGIRKIESHFELS